MRIAEDIQNYYEHMVIEYIVNHWDTNKLSDIEEILPDVMCVALNHLPPRYIRYEIDMAFYLSAVERLEMEQKVEDAVLMAMKTVQDHHRQEAEEQDGVLEVSRRPAVSHFTDEGDDFTQEDTPGKLSLTETITKLKEELAKKSTGQL